MTRNRFVLCAFVLLAACQRPAEQVEVPVAPVALSAVSAVAATGASKTDAFQAAWGSASPVTYRAPDAGIDDEAMTYSRGTLVPLSGDRFALVSEGQGGEGQEAEHRRCDKQRGGQALALSEGEPAAPGRSLELHGLAGCHSLLSRDAIGCTRQAAPTAVAGRRAFPPGPGRPPPRRGLAHRRAA